jgi:methylmalonyl-CoA mutase cobalamin-binding subunit
LPTLLEEVVVPLMHRIGEGWESGELRPVQEHMAVDIVRNFLGSLRTCYAPTESAPHLTVTTPSGQLHELGALVVATAAAADGWNVTYLGACLPAEEIARAAKTRASTAVALSIVYPTDDGDLPGELLRLRRCLPDGTVLLVGGRASTAYMGAIEAAGGRHLTCLRATREALCDLRQA